MKKLAVCFALGLALAPTSGLAQVDIDTTRISCGEFVALSPGEIETTAAWFSGWFNQKLNDTSIDLEAFRKNTRNVVAFCKDHPNDQLFGVLQLAVNRAIKKH